MHSDKWAKLSNVITNSDGQELDQKQKFQILVYLKDLSTSVLFLSRQWKALKLQIRKNCLEQSQTIEVTNNLLISARYSQNLNKANYLIFIFIQRQSVSRGFFLLSTIKYTNKILVQVSNLTLLSKNIKETCWWSNDAHNRTAKQASISINHFRQANKCLILRMIMDNIPQHCAHSPQAQWTFLPQVFLCVQSFVDLWNMEKPINQLTFEEMCQLY